MKYEIYIKGCEDRSCLASTCAMIIKHDGEMIQKSAARFEKFIGKGEDYPIIKNKAQFQMELYALAWAFSLIKDEDATFKVFTNNLPVAGWIKKWSAPKDYDNLFFACDFLRRERDVEAEHISKKSDIEENKLMNNAAEYLLCISGTKVKYVF